MKKHIGTNTLVDGTHSINVIPKKQNFGRPQTAPKSLRNIYIYIRVDLGKSSNPVVKDSYRF